MAAGVKPKSKSNWRTYKQNTMKVVPSRPVLRPAAKPPARSAVRRPAMPKPAVKRPKVGVR